MIALALDGVSSGYGTSLVLENVSLQVDEGSVVALLGPNGAGKSTLLRTASGLVRPRAGRVVVAGRDVTGLPAHRIASAGVAHAPEGRRLFPRMSVEANLWAGAYLRRDRSTAADEIESLLEAWPVINRRRHQPAGMLSGGEQQIVALGRALLSNPRVLMLDEPSLGLAPVLIAQVYKTLSHVVRDRSRSVLLVEQNAVKALELADVAYVLVDGRIVHSGPADKISASDVASLYLGAAAS